MVSNDILLLMLTKISGENPFGKFGRDWIGAVEMLWDSGIIPVSDVMCSVLIINSIPKYTD